MQLTANVSLINLDLWNSKGFQDGFKLSTKRNSTDLLETQSQANSDFSRSAPETKKHVRNQVRKT